LEIVDYLFEPEQEDKRSATRELIAILLENNLLAWDDSGERRGLRLNETVAHPTRKWVSMEPDDRMTEYHAVWKKTVDSLANAYPSVNKEEYEGLIQK
jgi:hypothetical protein